jgi:hypothetical protein
MRSLIFIISAIAVFRGAAADSGSDCTYDPIPACEKRNFGKNFVQYTGNPCNPSSFYKCEKVRGDVIAHLQLCKPCLDWSDDTWGCTIRNGKPCEPTEAPITEVISQVDQYCQRTGNGPAGVYTQQYRTGEDDTKYYWVVFGQELLFPCPPGTYFAFTPCKCIACNGRLPCAGYNPRVFTLDFDGKGSEGGIYYVVDESGVLSSDSISGVSLQFNGESTDIEVPFFQNNEFSEFKFDGYFKRDSAGGDGEQGILFNGASPQVDCWPGSIFVISSSPTSLRAGIVTDAGSFEIGSTAEIAADEWTRVTLSYNGTLLSLTVNGRKDSTPASGTTLRTKCNLYFGKSYDVSGVEHFFSGKLDDLSWYRVAS